MEMASIFVPGGMFVKAGYEMLKGNGAQAIKDLAFNLVTGAVVGAVAGLVVKGGAKALGAIGRTIKNSKPCKALANTFQKAPKIFNGKNADKVDDFARGLSRNTNKVADDVAEGVVKKSNKTDDVASKVGKGRKTGQGSIVPTVDRGNRTPRPTNYSYGVDDAIESGNSPNVYIPMDADGNPIPLRKQTVNGQDIPLPDPNASGPHTVLGGKVSSKTGEVYGQSATFPEGTWPTANGQNVPWSEVHWTDHGTLHHHSNPHQHIIEYNPDKGGWIRKGPTPYYP